ncbi:MAG: DUF1631 family protein [Gammaproteobacteria bacterium]|nr:DUF1631 family protein [Gammaproteobacteria bacterium]
MERRTYNRSPVRLDAVVHDRMYRSWDFIIEDFGFDGLRLSWNNKELMPGSIGVDDLLDVKFTIKSDVKSDQHIEEVDYHLEVKVIRVLDQGLAVTLFNPGLDALAELSRKQHQSGMHGDATLARTLDKKSQNLLDTVRHSFIKNMSHMTEIFLPIVHDELFRQAESSSNNTEQTLYFDAINTLNKTKKSLKIQFIKLLEKHLNTCCEGNKKNNKKQDFDELELIDQNDYENWLAVNQLIIHVSPLYEQELIEIELRLAHLLNTDIKNLTENPFSPETIFNSFSETIHNHFLNNDILLILYHQFKKVVDSKLFDTYKEINKIFIDQNILPIIEKKKLKIVKESSGSDISSRDNFSTKTDESATTELSANSNHSAKQQPQNQIENNSNASFGNNNQALASNAHLSEINTINNNVNLVPTYQTLKELLSFQNGEEVDGLSQDFFDSDEYKNQLDYLISELTQIQYKQAKDVTQNGITPFDLESLVQNCIKKEIFSIEIKNEFEYTVDIIKRLFDSIQNDAWLGRPVKKLLSLLKIPLLKVSLLHKDFFESWSNPARILMNKLAMVDFDDEKNNFYLKAHSFVLFILKNYDKDLSVFSKVQEVLTELLDIQSKHYKKNVNRVVTHWNAQQVVTNEIANRLAGKSTPLIIADFISYQWLPILVNTYLKQGKESNQWSQYLQALDMLILSMSGDVSEEFIDKDVILFIIKQGLEENGQLNKKIIDAISLFLSEGKSDNGVQLDYESIIKLLINGYALSDKSAFAKINKGVTDAMALANKAIAKRLKVNDYVNFKQHLKKDTERGNRITRLQYIWGSDAQNVFVFSGRTGQQQAVFNLTEVISMLDNGQLCPTKDYDLPLLERSLYAILGDVHDDLAKDSVLDKLTGLINQKEFVRLLTQKLQGRKKDDSECTLFLIDIDHFSLINDTCGYDAGDQYISEISRDIKNSLPSDVICARYGTCEFIVLLPGYSEVEASIISESQRCLVNHHNFKWDDKEFTMTASIGQVSIRQRAEIGVFIKAVVTASTIAKETGRNRVHLIEYDALELNYRQELQIWATKIEHMVKNNRFDIRGQRLHPILDESALQHYEMLLLVKDDNDDFMPPSEFIEAAELYNKMAEVDRWVINYVFDWFSRHPEQLEIMGGIAINLSGQSLNDVDFYPFILDVFQQYPSIPHNRICFEITETMAINNISHANNIIHTIKEMGCEFSLDDFGTGQSSYAYLKNLPVDYLKIDGVFIKDIANNPEDKAMVKSINEIGHFLGMKTVAEYVENDEIVAILKEIGVDYVQGYGVEKPIFITQYMDVIESRGTDKILS